jgi:hypothetical protein
MSVPKQVAKRRRLEKKRLRKRQGRLKLQKSREARGQRADFFEPLAAMNAPAFGQKMSQVLGDFVAPVTGCANNLTDWKRLLSLGMIAWNSALQPPHCREAIINSAIDEGLRRENLQDRQADRKLVDWLIMRKLESFANYQRPIVAFQIDELEDGGYYLSVVSAALP